MTTSRPSDTAVLSQNLRGNTAHIMVTLYKSMMGMQKANASDPILKVAAAGEGRLVELRVGQAKANLEIPATMSDARDNINVNLNKMYQEIKAKKPGEEAQKLFQSFTNKFSELSTNLNELQRLQGTLIDRYMQMIKEQHAMVEKIYAEREKKDGKPMSYDEFKKYISSSLDSFEKEVKDFDKKKQDLLINFQGLESSLGPQARQVETPFKPPTIPGGRAEL